MPQDRIVVTLITKAPPDMGSKYEYRSALLEPDELDRLLGVPGASDFLGAEPAHWQSLGFEEVEISADVEDVVLDPVVVCARFSDVKVFSNAEDSRSALGQEGTSGDLFPLDFGENDFAELEDGLVRN